MIVLTLKRIKDKQQHYKAEEWCNNTHQLIPAHYTEDRPGYFKQELRDDIRALAYNLKKFTVITTTESIVEKNKENKYYHAHLIIHGEDNRATVETLLRRIKVSSKDLKNDG